VGKTSKVKSVPRNKVGKPLSEADKKYVCCRCGRAYPRPQRNFFTSHSQLFAACEGFLPWCRFCSEDVRKRLAEKYGEEEGMRRTCLHFDWYWSAEIYARMNEAPAQEGITTCAAYRRLAAQPPNTEKTSCDTLDEEAAAAAQYFTMSPEIQEKLTENVLYNGSPPPEPEPEPELPPVTDEMRVFWGGGFTPADYWGFQNRYAEWVKHYASPDDIMPADQTLLRQICMQEVSIARDMAAGKPTTQATTVLNTLIGSANLKPVQRQAVERATGSATDPLGVMIKIYENDKPIPEPDPELADVDNMGKNILTWFLGALAAMAKVKNRWSNTFYDEAMRRLTVRKPSYDLDEGGGGIPFSDLFEDAHGDEEGGE
jgi:hypothetical protein